MNKWLPLALVPLMATGCFEKSGEYEYSGTRDALMISKSKIDSNKVYLYVPSTGATPRYSADADPFYQGDPKLVQFRFTSQGLEVLEIDREAELLPDGTISQGRYISPGEEYELPPVLLIPGEYVAFQCAEDQFGECTNTEEEVSDSDLLEQYPELNSPDKKHLIWTKKNYFKPDYENLKTLEKNWASLWFNSGSLIEQSNDISKLELTDSTLNIELEKSYSVSFGSLYYDYFMNPDFWRNGSFSDLSFKTHFYYSLVDVNELASKNYTPIYYSETDDKRFGFFDIQRVKNSQTGSSYFDTDKYKLLTRFNPGKDSIDYHLSDTFNKSENLKFKQATYNVVERINATLEAENINVPKINLVEPSGKHSGDLRYSMINLVDDPLKNGLLGYGPSVQHPLTGETVKAHVNQYSGVTRTLSRRTWNEVSRLYNRNNLTFPEASTPESEIASNIAIARLANSTALPTIEHSIDTTLQAAPLQQVAISSAQALELKKQLTEYKLHNSQPKTQFDSELEKLAYQNDQRIARWSEKTAFGEEAIWVSSTQKGFIAGLNPKDYEATPGVMKTWVELTEMQRQVVSDAITLQIYKSTLVHELGHNIGLRHNFSGSIDKANFYTSAEAKLLGMEIQPAYSSVMDYGASNLDELHMFGKYDLAALRFGYNRQLAMVNIDDKQTSLDNGVHSKTVTGYMPLAGYDAAYAAHFSNKEATSPVPYGVFEYLEDAKSDIQPVAKTLADAQEQVSQVAEKISSIEADVATQEDLISNLENEQIQLNAVISDPDTTDDVKQQAQDRLNAIELIDSDEIKSGELPNAIAALETANNLLAQFQENNKELNSQLATAQQAYNEIAANYPLMTDSDRVIIQSGSFDSYKFCNDGNVLLNSDCNRFDEGTNLEEITQFRIQNYRDLYTRVNFRDGRQSFWEEDLLSYTIWRLRGLSEIRDVIEDYEFYDQISDSVLVGETNIQDLISFCEQTDDFKAVWGEKFWACQPAREVEKGAFEAGRFMLDLVKQPDQTCQLQLDDGSDEIKSVALQELFDNAKYQLPKGYPSPSTCFDKGIQSLGRQGAIFSSTLDGSVPFTVMAESGRYLNGFKNYDPDRPYSNERDVLGSWPDRLLAMQMLVRRESRRPTADDGFMALIDVPSIDSDYKNLLRHIAIQEQQVRPTPYLDSDRNEMFPEENNKMLFSTLTEVLAWDTSPALSHYFNLNHSGKTSLNRSLLNQVAKFGYRDDETTQDQSEAVIKAVQVKPYALENESLLGAKTVVYKEDVYQATPQNELAYEIIGNYEAKPDILALNDKGVDIAEVYFNRSFPLVEYQEMYDAYRKVVAQALEGLTGDERTTALQVLAGDLYTITDYVAYYSDAELIRQNIGILQLENNTDSWFVNNQDKLAFWSSLNVMEKFDAAYQPLTNAMVNQGNTYALHYVGGDVNVKKAYEEFTISQLDSVVNDRLDEQLNVLSKMPKENQ